MKKLVLMILALAMVLSMAGCGCDHQWEEATCQAPKTCSLCGQTQGETAGHTPGQLSVASVDTANLTLTQEQLCGVCAEVLEVTESATGTAPVDGVLTLSPEEWFACLSTVIRTYESSGMLIPLEAESQDGALLYSVLTLSGFRSAIAFYDSEGNVLTTEQASERNKVHEICVEAQFDNTTAESFYTLLLLMGMNNNSQWTNDGVNQLGTQVMAGETVSDNGYCYSMQILSIEDHTVSVSIIAE